MIELQSAQSMRVSLESIRCGEGGLDEHRAAMLRRVPDVGDWANFPYEHLTMKDLAYLTAKTGHEFAILRESIQTSCSMVQGETVLSMMILRNYCCQNNLGFTVTPIPVRCLR